MGFFIENIIYILIPVIPNLIFLFIPPKSVPAVKPGERGEKLLAVLERVGQIGMLVLPLFWKVQTEGALQVAAIIVMAGSALFYYAGWLRYYIRGGEYAWLFAPMLKIPVPMAVSPALYFLALSAAERSPVLGAAAVIFAAGHIPLSWRNYRNTGSEHITENSGGK